MLFTGAGVENTGICKGLVCVAEGIVHAMRGVNRKKSASVSSPFPARHGFIARSLKFQAELFFPLSSFRQLRRLDVSLKTHALFQTTTTVPEIPGPGGKSTSFSDYSRE